MHGSGGVRAPPEPITLRRVRPGMRPAIPILAEPPPTEKAVPMNVLSREEKVQVLHMLVEGTSLRSVTRLTGIHRTSVMKLMLKAGDALREFLDAKMKNLELTHLECDEIWTFVRKKQV